MVRKHHVIIYVPGLGDSNDTGRRAILRSWRIYGIKATLHAMNWSDKQPFEPKLSGLLSHIDELVSAGNTVSLVGESAGASAALNAYAVRQDVIHRVAFICGKLKHAETIGSHTYAQNPAFAESMALLPVNLLSLPAEKLKRCLSVHPLADSSVPIADTQIPGMQIKTIPTSGHFLSILLGTTLFSWILVGFLKKE